MRKKPDRVCAGNGSFPAPLSAVLGKDAGIGKRCPALDAVVHDFIDFPDFPLLRLVKGMVQGFLVELLDSEIKVWNIGMLMSGMKSSRSSCLFHHSMIFPV